MEKPLPCPFCGGKVAPTKLTNISMNKDQALVYEGSGRYYIQCYNDDCEVNPRIDRPSDTEEEVICKWNKRKEN